MNKNINIGYEETIFCKQCGKDYDSDMLLSNCPECGTENVNCDPCLMYYECKDCIRGSKFVSH